MVGPTQVVLDMVAYTQEDYMLDMAIISSYRLTGLVDDLGTPESEFVDGPEIACSVDDTSAVEQMATAQVDTHDAVIRFPVGTEVYNADQVKITVRMTRRLDSPVRYEINGKIDRGLCGVICPLKLYTGVSDG